MGPDPLVVNQLNRAEVVKLPMWVRQALLERDAYIEYQRGVIWGSSSYQDEIERLRGEVEELKAILRDLVDDDPCSYDHHGYCQAHFWLRTEPPCPHKRGKALLEAAKGVRDAD